MGLFDSVVGAVLNNAGQAGGNAAGGGLGGLLGMAAQNPQLVQAVLSLLSNDGAHGGLAGLVERFQQAGLGNVLQSWIGTGANLPISGEQLASVLGQGTLSQLGSQVGAAPADVAQQLSQLLPGLVDRLTPQGQMPQGGLGNSSDLMGVLGQFFRA
ncbi:YidB family protein [Acidovorax temperans]|jgi:uncharacterized protein YidB (DUF937 family)|uniref:YidB family protein n=1 Tax=Acidovorax temperans TaxID=80878 RepID=UPI001A93C652|nr:YidB family protein [Acidovorax temperans]MBP6579561.1 DUF937 domain-containing protein [Acidovorax sp.]MBO0942276.1 DUF937 domain-containing protein [Acidovorax temperans]WCT24654.1 YidB family protein [Acidovorax temperans]HRL53996.1 YidB family protein [Acidovorax temperans]HRM82938.1 YidB family protein [Acidovorax temperans]